MVIHVNEFRFTHMKTVVTLLNRVDGCFYSRT